jgi:type IV pilus assembly protein PilB
LATSGPEESKDRAIESILDQIGTDDVRVVESPLESEADLEASARESPVVALVNNIIKSAVRLSASDIHIEPAEGTLRVRCRVDGELVVTARPTLRLLPAVVSRIKILGGMDISQRRMPQDGGVTVTLFGRSVDLRISTMATKFGEKVVIRIVDREGGLRKLHEIGMAPPMLERFRGALQEPNGILLVTGPTGSGKSTTMYAALVEILNDRRNVSTIEDPVERIVPGLNQFQVNPKAGFTFATAMRSMLRQDPDVIMVGEIRDSETAKLAAEAALTGHLVLSTLHTNDAPSAVPRLVNMGVESYLVAAAVRGVLAQRLVRRLCPNCVKPVAPTAAQRGVLRRLQPEGPPLEQAFEASGCGQCGSSGVRGRVGVYDFLAVSESMTPLFDVLSNPQSLKRLSLEGGSQGLLPDGLERVRRGEIGIDSLLELVSRSTSNEPAIAA